MYRVVFAATPFTILPVSESVQSGMQLPHAVVVDSRVVAGGSQVPCSTISSGVFGANATAARVFMGASLLNQLRSNRVTGLRRDGRCAARCRNDIGLRRTRPCLGPASGRLSLSLLRVFSHPGRCHFGQANLKLQMHDAIRGALASRRGSMRRNSAMLSSPPLRTPMLSRYHRAHAALYPGRYLKL